MTAAHVLTTVWCGQCADEGRSSPGMLGQLQRQRSGAVVWGVWHRRGSRMPDGSRTKLFAMQVIEHPRREIRDIPDVLPALCERHGAGSVSTGAVLAASGNVVLNLQRHADK